MQVVSFGFESKSVKLSQNAVKKNTWILHSSPFRGILYSSSQWATYHIISYCSTSCVLSYLSLNVADFCSSLEGHRCRPPLCSGKVVRCSSGESSEKSQSWDLRDRRMITLELLHYEQIRFACVHVCRTGWCFWPHGDLQLNQQGVQRLSHDERFLPAPEF